MDTDNIAWDRDPTHDKWDMSRTAKQILLALLAKLEAESELATGLGEYRLARLLLWERERMRLVLHPPTAATAFRNTYRKNP
jgi:hypothetical protein